MSPEMKFIFGILAVIFVVLTLVVYFIFKCDWFLDWLDKPDRKEIEDGSIGDR